MAGSGSFAGAANTFGCSAQYPLNSVRLVDDRIKGGAVREERSPLNEEMDYDKLDHLLEQFDNECVDVNLSSDFGMELADLDESSPTSAGGLWVWCRL